VPAVTEVLRPQHLGAMTKPRLAEAGDMLAAFSDHLHPQDLPPVLRRLVELAAGKI
jgi:hypothetical protein